MNVIDRFDLSGVAYSLLAPPVAHATAPSGQTYLALICEAWPDNGSRASYVLVPHPVFTEWWT